MLARKSIEKEGGKTKGLKLGRSKDGKGLPSSSWLDDWLCLPPFTLTLLYFTISLCHFIGKACFSPSWQLIIFLASCFETWREMRNSSSKMAFWCWTLTFKGMKYKWSCGYFHPYPESAKCDFSLSKSELKQQVYSAFCIRPFPLSFERPVSPSAE